MKCVESQLHFAYICSSANGRSLSSVPFIFRVASHSKGTGESLEILACPDFLEIEGLWALLGLAHKVPQARRGLRVSRGAQEPLEIQVSVCVF